MHVFFLRIVISKNAGSINKCRGGAGSTSLHNAFCAMYVATDVKTRVNTCAESRRLFTTFGRICETSCWIVGYYYISALRNEVIIWILRAHIPKKNLCQRSSHHPLQELHFEGRWHWTAFQLCVPSKVHCTRDFLPQRSWCGVAELQAKH